MALAPRRLRCMPARLRRAPTVNLQRHPRRCAEASGVKFGIAHAVRVALEVVGALSGLLTTSCLAEQRLADAL